MINHHFTSKKRAFQVVIITLILLATSFVYSEKKQNKQASIGGDFTLTDHNDEPFSLDQLRGKMVILFFGYTYCPDICPSELTTMARLLKQLGNESDKVSALFVSVDQKEIPLKN